MENKLHVRRVKTVINLSAKEEEELNIIMVEKNVQSMGIVKLMGK